MIIQFKITDILYFTREILTTTKIVTVKSPTHHILVIDCSGSMYDDLRNIRKQLKNKLPNLVQEGDSVSIIWFSGKNEYGILKEEVYLNSLKALNDLNDAIDRFLQPQGLTGFVGPLLKTEELINRISKNNKDSKYSMLFLTDGHDNQHSKNEILNQVHKLSSVVNSATFVEYGYYCNRALLTQMAETIGGTSIFSESFDDYEPLFDKFILNNNFSSKKIEHHLAFTCKNNYIFAIDNGNIISYKVEDDKVLLPESITDIYYLSTDNKSTCSSISDKEFYALLYTLSVRMLSNDIYDVLGALGDKYLIDKYSNAYGKFNITDFQSTCLKIFNGTEKTFIDGEVDSSYLPNPNAYCVMNLLEELSSNEKNLFYPDHEAFSYSRIGAAKQQKSSRVSDSDLESLKTLTEELANSKSLDKINEIQKKIEEVKSNIFKLEFKKFDDNKGYKITDFVYNATRPNVSVRVRYDGYVDLSKLPDTKLNKIDSFIYRTYNIIKDGIINIKQLPVSLSLESFQTIMKETNLLDEEEEYFENKIFVLDLTKLPIVNRSMVTSTSAKELAKKSFEHLKLQAKQKVFNHFFKLNAPKESKSFLETYGEKTTNWLNELGITDYNGFAPKYESVKSSEEYNSTELDVKIAGFSSLPSVNDVLKKLPTGKFTPREGIMAQFVIEYNKFLESEEYKDSKNKEEFLKVWLENKTNSAIKRTRELNSEISKIKFSVILSQSWFTDLESIEDTKLSLDIDGTTYDFEFVLADTVVKI
jgi:hypothetical protein